MAFTNFETKEINCKILYLGPSGAGKSSNLRAIFNQTSPEVKAGLLELSEEGVGRSVFFEFLPVSVGFVRNYHLKLHLYTIPAQSLYDTVRSVIMKGVDGFVFVADSSPEKLACNVEELQIVRKIFSEEGLVHADMPSVIQYNKRDMAGAVPVEVLRSELNPSRHVDVEACAKHGLGVLESLQEIAAQVIRRMAG
jgi:hypothetical protein